MRLRFAVGSSYLVAVLLVAIALAGLLVPGLYGRETAAWIGEVRAQDWFDLVVAAPLLVIAAHVARSSARGRLALAGMLLYVVYTLLIDAFAMHLNALTLVYCAALGLALYALIALPSGPRSEWRGT